MEWFWCKNYIGWIKETWKPRHKFFFEKTDEAFWLFLAGNWLMVVGIGELIFDFFARPFADIFKLGYYYREK